MISEVGTTPMSQISSAGGWGENGTSWLLWVLVLFALFAGNGFGFGGRNDQITNDFLFSNLNTTMQNGIAQLDGGIRAIQNGICDSTYALNNSIKDGFYSTNITTRDGFSDIQSSLANLGYMMKDCCCSIQRTIENDGAETRNLITCNTIQNLRDELCDTKLALSNANQSQEILNSLGSYRPYNCCC